MGNARPIFFYYGFSAIFNPGVPLKNLIQPATVKPASKQGRPSSRLRARHGQYNDAEPRPFKQYLIPDQGFLREPF
jgi:hypothetical protein